MKNMQTMTLKGFAARDKKGFLFFYPGNNKPVRVCGFFLPVDYSPFPCISIPEDNIDITWEDEPREAILTVHLDVEPK